MDNNIIVDSNQGTKQLYVIGSGVLLASRLYYLVLYLSFWGILSFVMLTLTVIGLFQILFTDKMSNQTIRIIQVAASIEIFFKIAQVIRELLNFWNYTELVFLILTNSVVIILMIMLLVKLRSASKKQEEFKTGMIIVSVLLACIYILSSIASFSLFEGGFRVETIPHHLHDLLLVTTDVALILGLVWICIEKRIGLYFLIYASIFIVVASLFPTFWNIQSSIQILQKIMNDIVYILLLIVIVRTINQPVNKQLTEDKPLTQSTDSGLSPFEIS